MAWALTDPPRQNPNFAVKSESGLAHCHSQCGRGWDIFSLEMELSGCDFPRAKEAVFSIIGRPAPSREDADVEARYDYVDADGNCSTKSSASMGKSSSSGEGMARAVGFGT
jgi:hypothetical protein